MQHQQVIEIFINQGNEGRGSYVKAGGDVLYSQFTSNYRPYGRYNWQGERTKPIGVRLQDASLLVNGAGLSRPESNYQMDVLTALRKSHNRFGVVPYHSIVAAFTDGEV